MSAFESIYGDQFTLSTQLIKLNCDIFGPGSTAELQIRQILTDGSKLELSSNLDRSIDRIDQSDELS